MVMEVDKVADEVADVDVDKVADMVVKITNEDFTDVILTIGDILILLEMMCEEVTKAE